MSRKPRASVDPAPARVGPVEHGQDEPRLASPGDGPWPAPSRKGDARRLVRPYGFVDDTGTPWHWRSGQVVTGDVLIALEARGAPLGPLETESSIMRVRPTGRFGEER